MLNTCACVLGLPPACSLPARMHALQTCSNICLTSSPPPPPSPTSTPPWCRLLTAAAFRCLMLRACSLLWMLRSLTACSTSSTAAGMTTPRTVLPCGTWRATSSCCWPKCKRGSTHRGKGRGARGREHKGKGHEDMGHRHRCSRRGHQALHKVPALRLIAQRVQRADQQQARTASDNGCDSKSLLVTWTAA